MSTRSIFGLARAGPLAGAAAALALAIAGELTVRTSAYGIAAIPLYLAAIVIWTLTARPLPIDTERSSGRLRSPGRLAFGLALAVVLDGIALVVLRGHEHSNAAARPWVASLAALAATAALAGRLGGWAPRWRGADRAALRSRWTWLAVAALVGLAETLRLVRLDRIPLGINADEGDRAAVALQILHGVPTPSIFEGGWYRISMVYFWTLAQAMRVFGTNYADVRVLGALAGTVTVAVVTWIGLRHFGLRVGLIAGGLLTVLGVALQFSRETSEAGPTAMFWTISMAFLLEGVRSGKASSWIGAGMAGGACLYFYPSGRSWILFAAIFFGYLAVCRFGIPRRQILLRAGLSLLAAVLVMAPFLSYGVRHPEALYGRASETTVLDRANAARLGYYDPDWSTPRLLGEQAVRSIGILDRFADAGGFWPTGRPILTAVLALLTVLGLGWTCLRWRDPRAVLLGLWFAIGLAGVVFTVETPNLQRMAIAVPALTLFAALVLDDLRGRVWIAAGTLAPRWRQAGRWAAELLIVGLVAWVAWSETSFYFRDYAHLDRWVRPNAEGEAVAEQGLGTLVVTLGRSFHMVNSGWVRLLAQHTPRGGMQAPGSDLPLTVPAKTDLAFMLYAEQLPYLPLLRAQYPEGRLRRYSTPTEGLMFVLYRIPRSRWAAQEGARLELPGGRTARVDTFGEVPAGWSRHPSRLRWSAGLRVPQFGNYAFSTGGAHATLAVDGQEIIRDGSPRRAVVALPAGMHAVELVATWAGPSRPLLRWSGAPLLGDSSPLRPVGGHELDARQTHPVGLSRKIDAEGEPTQRRIDGTIASCCLYDEGRGGPLTARWEGTLVAPRSGFYTMSLFSQGVVELRIDRELILRSTNDADSVTRERFRLRRGMHRVDISYRIVQAPGGLEWTWTPPRGRTSIVPPSVLRPRGGGPRPPLSSPAPIGRGYEPLVVVP